MNCLHILMGGLAVRMGSLAVLMGSLAVPDKSPVALPSDAHETNSKVKTL